MRRLSADWLSGLSAGTQVRCAKRRIAPGFNGIALVTAAPALQTEGESKCPEINTLLFEKLGKHQVPEWVSWRIGDTAQRLEKWRVETPRYSAMDAES